MRITVLVQESGGPIKKAVLTNNQRNAILQSLQSLHRGQVRTSPEAYRITINHKVEEPKPKKEAAPEPEASETAEEQPAVEPKPKNKGGRRRKNPLPVTEDAPEDQTSA